MIKAKDITLCLGIIGGSVFGIYELNNSSKPYEGLFQKAYNQTNQTVSIREQEEAISETRFHKILSTTGFYIAAASASALSSRHKAKDK